MNNCKRFGAAFCSAEFINKMEPYYLPEQNPTFIDVIGVFFINILTIIPASSILFVR